MLNKSYDTKMIQTQYNLSVNAKLLVEGIQEEAIVGSNWASYV
jgi:hypothetical protein